MLVLIRPILCWWVVMQRIVMNARRLCKGRSIFSRATENGTCLLCNVSCAHTSTQRSAGPRTAAVPPRYSDPTSSCEHDFNDFNTQNGPNRLGLRNNALHQT